MVYLCKYVLWIVGTEQRGWVRIRLDHENKNPVVELLLAALRHGHLCVDSEGQAAHIGFLAVHLLLTILPVPHLGPAWGCRPAHQWRGEGEGLCLPSRGVSGAFSFLSVKDSGESICGITLMLGILWVAVGSWIWRVWWLTLIVRFKSLALSAGDCLDWLN